MKPKTIDADDDDDEIGHYFLGFFLLLLPKQYLFYLWCVWANQDEKKRKDRNPFIYSSRLVFGMKQKKKSAQNFF